MNSIHLPASKRLHPRASEPDVPPEAPVTPTKPPCLLPRNRCPYRFLASLHPLQLRPNHCRRVAQSLTSRVRPWERNSPRFSRFMEFAPHSRRFNPPQIVNFLRADELRKWGSQISQPHWSTVKYLARLERLFSCHPRRGQIYVAFGHRR
jgi:hypothetical protein